MGNVAGITEHSHIRSRPGLFPCSSYICARSGLVQHPDKLLSLYLGGDVDIRCIQMFSLRTPKDMYPSF